MKLLPRCSKPSQWPPGDTGAAQQAAGRSMKHAVMQNLTYVTVQSLDLGKSYLING